MTTTLELRPDGPHSDAYIVQVARGMAEAVRVLNHATASHADAGLTLPATVYDVLGATRTAVARQRQLFDQLGVFLGEQMEAGRLADHVRDPAVAVQTAQSELLAARAAADHLERALTRAQAAINGLYVRPKADDGLDGWGEQS